MIPFVNNLTIFFLLISEAESSHPLVQGGAKSKPGDPKTIKLPPKYFNHHLTHIRMCIRMKLE